MNMPNIKFYVEMFTCQYIIIKIGPRSKHQIRNFQTALLSFFVLPFLPSSSVFAATSLLQAPPPPPLPPPSPSSPPPPPPPLQSSSPPTNPTLSNPSFTSILPSSPSPSQSSQSSQGLTGSNFFSFPISSAFKSGVTSISQPPSSAESQTINGISTFQQSGNLDNGTDSYIIASSVAANGNA